MTTKKKPAAKKSTTKIQSPLRVGNTVLIRTVTMIQVGRVESLVGDIVLLSGASWVADTERFGTCLTTGAFREVEKIPGAGVCGVGRGAIVDFFDWPHALPTESK